MVNLFKLFAKRGDQLKLQKSDSGDNYVVKRGFNILYIGTKEKCQTFINQGAPA